MTSTVGAAADGWELGPLDDLPEGAGRGFSFGSGLDYFRLFVVRKDGALHAFENACPHLGTPLDVIADRFFTGDRARLICGTHGARFRIADGVCVSGPCEGEGLARLVVTHGRGGVRVARPDPS